MNHSVYIATNPGGADCYVGYCDSNTEPRAAFLAQASTRKQRGEERGDSKLLELNDGTTDGMTFEVIETFEEEKDAFIARNDLRIQNKDTSITGPSVLPALLYRRVSKDKQEAWKKAIEESNAERKRAHFFRNCATARQVHQGWLTNHKLVVYKDDSQRQWSHIQLKAIRDPMMFTLGSKDAADKFLLQEMSTMSPKAFAEKYDLPWQWN